MVLDHDFEEFPELSNSQLQSLRFLSPHPQILEDFDAIVVKVSDGDTIRVTTSFRDFDFPIRLLDIDSPELSEGGKEAKEWLTQRILGEEVRILIDSTNRVGKYGRLLGRVLSQGLDIGQEELNLGLAVPFGSKNEGEPLNIEKIFRSGQWFK